MRKIRNILLFFLLLIIFFEISINLILFLYKANFKKFFFKNADIKEVYYIFPNILLIKDIEFVSFNYSIHIKRTLFYINLFKIFRKDLIIHSIMAKNISLEVLDTNDSHFFKGLDADSIKQNLFKFLDFMPSKMSLKNASIKYKNQTVFINRIIKTTIDKNKKSIFYINGRFSKYYFNFNLSIFNNNSWLVKGRIFLPSFGVGVNNIDLEIFGDFDFYKPQNYILKVNKDNANFLYIKGDVNFSTLEINGNIDTNFGKAIIKTIREDDKFKINFDGSFNFKLYKFVINKINLQNIRTNLYFVFSDSGFKIDSKIYLPEAALDFNLENNKGSGYIMLYTLKQKIPFNIIYSDENIKIYNNFNKYPLDFKIDFSKEKELSISGKILDHFTCLKIHKNNKFWELRSNFVSDNHKFKFDYITDFSSGSIKVLYSDKKNTYISFDSILKEDKLNFNLISKKLNVGYLDDIKFFAKGEIKNVRKEGTYYLNLTLDDLYYKHYKILKNLYVTGKFNRENINLSFNDKLFYGNLVYDVLKDYGVLHACVDNKKLQIDKIKTDFLCNLKLEFKKDTLNLKGDYRIKSLYYDNKEIFSLSKGEITSSLKDIILQGKIFTKSNNVIDYNIIYDYTKKEITFKTKNVNFLPNVKKFDLFNIELVTKTEKLYPFNEISFRGKIYNDNSEVIISTFNISFINDNITAYWIIKNFKIKNLNFVGSMEMLVKDYSKNLKNFKLTFNNLWINEQYLDKVLLNFNYNTINKELIFLSYPNSSDIRFSGKISFLNKIIRFLDFKIFDNTKEYLTCRGTLGIDNEILKITAFKIPLNLVKNWFQIPIHNVDGLISSNIKVLTIDSNKNSYQLYSDFSIDEVNIETLRLKNILGKFSLYNNYLTFENIDLIFKENKRINIKGFLNFNNRNVDLTMMSHNCDLSIFNGFQNVIKSASGKLVFNLKVTGSMTLPNLNGYLNVTKGRIEFDEYLKYIDNININILFNEKSIKVDKFFGSYENTTFNVAGKLNLNEGYSVRLKTVGGEGIFIKIPELSFPVGQFFKIIKGEKFFPSNGNVHLDITLLKRKNQNCMVKGDIILNNTHFTYPGVSSKSKISSFGFYHDLNLIANNNVWYENEYLSTNISGKINFYFNEGMQKMNINGEATALRGKINFLNNNFDLTSGKLEIIDRTVYIQLTGKTEITSPEKERIPINLVIERSRIEDIKPKLTSPIYPELRTEEITSLLLGVGRFQRFGDKVSIVSTEKIDYLPLLRAQFIRMIDTTFATPIAKNILKRWGIADNFSIVSLGTSSERAEDKKETDVSYNNFKVSDIFKDTKYVIEKYITSDMLVSYSVAFAEIQNRLNLKHEIEISYKLKNNIFIKGLYDYSIRDYTNQYTPNVSIIVQPMFKFKTWAEEEKE